jgi:hypothetical protein
VSFGRNPHVAKAEAAEQKARSARDEASSERAWREAARQWDRAAEREADEKRRLDYSGKAGAARAIADDPRLASAVSSEGETPKRKPPALLN